MKSKKKKIANTLAVNYFYVVSCTIILVALVEGIVFFSKESYFYTLLLERGLSQLCSLFCFCFVFVFSLFKLSAIAKSRDRLADLWVADYIYLQDPESQDLIDLISRMKLRDDLLAVLLSKILVGYTKAKSVDMTIKFAEQQFFLMEERIHSSYQLSRLLVWAIPLIGFIGTILGISGATEAFSGVVSNAEDLEALRQEITNVTGGLAIAFDTTLLALVLSLPAKIMTSLMEQNELELLRQAESFFGENIFPRMANDPAIAYQCHSGHSLAKKQKRLSKEQVEIIARLKSRSE